MSHWDNYFKVHASRKPREQLVRAAALCKEKKSALDLGAGTLIESAYLVEEGFDVVTAVDSSPESQSFAAHIDPAHFSLAVVPFQGFQFKENVYDIVNAQYALPFYGKDGFDDFLQRVTASLKDGGIFVGQFFGIHDGWNTPDRTLAFQTKEEVGHLLKSFEIIELIEEDKEGKTAAGGSKHWHVFHFIARKG